ncbi:MAG TPA: DUF4129 domain-containing protein, partial [Gammaproteobacteria bacterium]|nr:DUF4129 domain-containing protein [Gammaproteobacteria bacterium]
MRLLRNLRLELRLAVVVALAPLGAPAQPEPAADVEPVPRAEVRKALDKVANDPNLVAERSVNMLRWAEAKPVTDEPWWWGLINGLARWFRGLFAWIAESGRYVVWVIGALLAAVLVTYVVRLVRVRGMARVPKTFAPPSHVRDLDIRPESLPDDVGSAALALWNRGEQRAALALLYRGLLSRLVHVHSVPIRASSTEGECVALARPRLAEANARYATRLVDTWG